MFRKHLVLAPLFALTLAQAAVAQSDSSSLSGTVTDASGAVLPNAKVTITNNATKATNTVTSNESGTYIVPNIPSGDYTVRVEVGGFQTYNVQNVHVDPSIGRRVDASLKIGESSSTVEVQSDANTV